MARSAWMAVAFRRHRCRIVSPTDPVCSMSQQHSRNFRSVHINIFFRIYWVQKIHIHWNRGDTCILAEKFIVYILYKSCKMCAWKQRQCIYSWSQSLTRYWTHCHTAIIMIEMTRMNKLSPPIPPPPLLP